MADIDTAAIRETWHPIEDPQTVLDLCDGVDRLRARLAEVEAERDAMTHEAFSRRKEQDRQAKTIEKLEDRLAAVEALCDQFRGFDFAVQVRAAARGEDDR